MDRERAETYLRLLAEAELRRATTMAARNSPGRWRSARLALAAQALSAVGPQQVLDLRVGLADTDPRVEPGQDQLGDAQAEAARELARDDLGDQGERSLPRAAELHHVGAEVVRLDDGGQ